MRDVASAVSKRFPVLKRNRAFYEVQRWRDSRVHQPDRSLTSRPELVDDLVRDGIAVVPGFASAEQVDHALSALDPWLSKLQHAEVDEESYVPSEDHHYFRLPAANERVPETGFFFGNELVHEVARAYLSREAAPYRFVAEWRFERRASVSAEDLFHFDSWRPVFKAFLYLVDVTADNGPFVYMKRSHRGGRWLYRRALEFEADGTDGSFGHFFPGEVSRLRRDEDWEELSVEAPAGTLVLADFRGLHRGSPIIDGRRVMLNCTFGMRRWAT